MIKLQHGIYPYTYEQQARDQGYTLGKKSEYYERMRNAFNTLRMNDFLTESQSDAICKKLQKRIVVDMKKLEVDG